MLEVGAVDDPLEREADSLAEQVLHMPDGERLRHKPATGSGPTYGLKGTTAPPTVYKTLCSPGEPLPAATRTFFEPRFGHDFSHVRVHSDASAEESARDLEARAYTVGYHIVIGSAFPSSFVLGADRLMAHELAHVVQQTRAHASMNRTGFARLQRDGKKDKASDRVTASKEKLKAKYKLRGITEEGGASWTEWELRAMERAISKMSKDEQAQLEGVTLIRTDAPLTVEHRGKKIKAVGLTSDSVIRFGKTALMSTMVPLHEIGHVLHNKAVSAAEARVHQSQSWRDLDTATALYDAAMRRVPRSGSAELMAFINSINAAETAAGELLYSEDADREEKEGQLVMAQGQADMVEYPLKGPPRPIPLPRQRWISTIASGNTRWRSKFGLTKNKRSSGRDRTSPSLSTS